jgi:lysophospholipase L1-like esterase
VVPKRSVTVALAALALLAAVPAARADETEARDPKKKYVVAALGDSLTDTRVGGGRYMAMLGKKCPESRFDAYGVGGQQTRHLRWRFTQDLFGEGLTGQQAKKPAYTHVIVLAGVNDLSGGVVEETRLAKTKEHFTWMYRTAHERSLKVVAMTVPPWGGVRGEHDRAVTADINGWIRDQARTGAVDHVVDIHPLLACGPNEALCEPLRKVPKDPIHWGDEGHSVVAGALFREVFSDCE